MSLEIRRLMKILLFPKDMFLAYNIVEFQGFVVIVQEFSRVITKQVSEKVPVNTCFKLGNVSRMIGLLFVHRSDSFLSVLADQGKVAKETKL